MFHITIGSAPKPDLSLEEDLRMVKTSLLYGDHVKLCSGTYSSLLPFVELTNYTTEQRIDFFERIIKYSRIQEPFKSLAWEKLRRWKQILQDKNVDEQTLLEAQRQIEEGWAHYANQSSVVPQANAMASFDRAIQEGLLTIHKFETLEEANIREKGFYGTDFAPKFQSEFVSVVEGSLKDGSTYPLFDDYAGKYVSQLIKAGTLDLSEPISAKARQSHLAAELLGGLPHFEAASINEILDIRTELEGPLVRFRGAIIGYAEKIKTASWDRDFSIEAKNVFHREIEPAVRNIAEAVKSNPSLLELATRKVVDKSALGTSIFSFMISQVSSLRPLTGMAMAAAVGASTAFYDAYKEWKKEQQTIEQNQLYFYYRAGNLLTEGDYQYRFKE
jgi:hypothetical protein